MGVRVITLAAAQALTWLLVAAVAVVMALLFRSLRGFYRVVAPAGALMAGGGPPPGAQAPTWNGSALDGTPVVLGGPRARMQLLLFVGEGCPISRKLAPIARDFARREALDLVFMGDDSAEAQERLVASFGLPRGQMVNDDRYGRMIGVDKLPFAALLGTEGAIVAKGLVNSREHLESLLTAHETGFATVQSYLAARSHAGHAHAA
ncbi:methylamine utilization protein MauD [Acetobacter sacchari]|uniref:Methylamine utilization protein MauD n=1 Tax=Acetobacter sacchari TaxID=2661687 RepID=A0ABS3LR94_9PROT|nr:methylamine utilization protein MauD [Acetobacter sacchari]